MPIKNVLIYTTGMVFGITLMTLQLWSLSFWIALFVSAGAVASIDYFVNK